MLALYTLWTPVLMSGIVNTIFTDEVLRKHYLSILYLCACFFFACCIITLSEHCKNQRKSKTKCDVDIESNDEQMTPEAALFLYLLKNSNPCKRPIYGMIVFTCAITSIICLLLLYAFHTDDDLGRGSDPWSAVMLSLISALAVLSIVFMVSYFEKYDLNSMNFSYKPFDENIKIPMNVYVPKIVAVLMTGQFNIFGDLLMQFISVIALVIVITAIGSSEQDVTEIMQGSKMDHTILICIMTCVNFFIFLFLIETLAKAHETTKKFLLGTFEKNWQWNLKAYEFLLPDIEISSLENLRSHLLEKFHNPQLKNEEKKVIDYIKRPLWQNKRAFVDTPEEVYETENQSPNSTPEIRTPPRAESPELQSNSSPSPKISPPLTRSRAKRQA